MAYTIYLSGIPMPVAPSKIEMKVKNQNTTLNLINGDEINIIKPPGLTEFSFELMIPQVKYPFAAYPDYWTTFLRNPTTDGSEQFIEAQVYLELFEILKKSLKPFQFKIERSRPDNIKLFDTQVDMLVTLEEYSIIEDAANGFDLTIPMRLKQYRPYLKETEPIELKKSISDSASAADKTNSNKVNSNKPKTYTVKKGDTLWGICKKYLGDGSKYPEIAKLNGIKNPNLIRIGQVIRLG